MSKYFYPKITFVCQSDEQKNQIKVQAEKSGLKLSEYCLMAVESFNSIKAIETIEMEKETLSTEREKLFQLRKIGNNLNQLTKLSHTHKLKLDFKEVEKKLLEILDKF